ncbi:MAG: hypothetical protein JOZ90_11445 [Alphaproteobacteria bacterium]|nr:hypothetical protein [Alphaproteobacteria bacterium]MBV9372212.1 hypothetical protein [Alphaproteobacteria bacterium]MBV9901700.1 hypothetical protein [Alphaproteobacteria bacterium]
MKAEAELHPALKESVLLTPYASGVYVGSGERGFFLKGGNLATLVGRLLAALDGRAAIAEVRDALPEAVSPLFDRIVDQLRENDLLTLGSLDEASGGGHPETARFLREHSRDWPSAMASIRDDPVCLAGAPDLVTATSLLLLDKGFGNLLVAADGLGPAQQAAIARCAAARPSAEGRPGARTTGLEGMPGAGADPSALLIALLDDEAGDDPPLPLEGWEERDCVAGIVRSGVGILAPCGPGALDAARRLARLCRGPDMAFSAAGRSALAALAAYEAVWARLRPNAGAGGPARDRFRLIRPDAAVSSHDVAATLAAGRPIAPGRPTVQATPPPGGAVHPGWFDPAQGPFEWVDAPGTGYPLAVRALRVRRGGQEEETTFTHWGLDSGAAEARTFGLAAALVAIEAAGLDAAVAAPVFAGTAAEAERLADCLARAAGEDFARRHAFQPVDPEGVAEPDLAMLVRLARLYAGALPALWVAGDGACWVARARSGERLSIGIAPSADAALVEALGDAIASHQCGAPVTRQALAPYARLARLHGESGDGLPQAGEAAGGSRFEPLQALAWEGGQIVVGAARLGRR